MLAAFYFVFFVAFGALYPLMPLFLRERGMSGTEIGTIVSIGTVMTVLFQPVWGMICDRYQAQRMLLVVTLLLASVFAAVYPFAHSYWLFFLLFAGMAAFHSSGVPIIDSISLSYVQRHGGDYGSLRLWGAIGFAVASWGAGKLSEMVSLSSIFYIYAGAYVVCVLISLALPQESNRMGVNLTAGLKKLFRIPRFMMFLFGTFLIFGTIQANNSYFGIFFTAIGGTVAGVGLSFLIAAGSEAPVMRFAGRLVARFGLIPMLATAGAISAARWLYYGMAPTPGWVMVLLFVQGLSVGLYLPAAAQFVRDTAPEEIRVTALGIYTAVGNGLGTMAGSVVGGILLDQYGIFHTYKAFGIASVIGVLAMLSLPYLSDGKAKTAAS